MRADCPVFLSKLYRQQHQLENAWTTIADAIKSPFEERRFSNNFYIYHCSLPLEASFTLLEMLQAEVIPRDSTLLFGWKLLTTAKSSCNSTSLGYLLENDDGVKSAEESYKRLASRAGNGISRLDDACVDASSSSNVELIDMLRIWGVAAC